jgi:DNA-binding Xre family transcriptional regulator
MPQPQLNYQWHLRRLLADQGIFATTGLGPLLAERGITLSEAQVYRLVTGTPERLSLRTLMALCDILTCTPNDLIEPATESAARAATGTSTHRPDTAAATTRAKTRTPRRADIRRQ